MSRWLKSAILLIGLILAAGAVLFASGKLSYAVADEDEEYYEDEFADEEQAETPAEAAAPAAAQPAAETATQPAAETATQPVAETAAQPVAETAAEGSEDDFLNAVESGGTEAPAAASEQAQPAMEQTAKPEAASAQNTRTQEDLLDEEQFLEEEAGISKEERITSDKNAKSSWNETLSAEEGEEYYTGGGEPELGAADEMAEIEHAIQESEKIPSILTNLDDCKRVALLNDKRVQVALKQVNYDRYKVLEAERTFLPSLKGTWDRQEGSQASDQKSGQDTKFNTLSYALEGEQVLFQGGKTIYTLKQAKANLEASKKKYLQARQEVVFKVEKAYYGVVKSQMIFEVQADLSKRAESSLSFSREAYRQGVNSYHEFLNVQSQTDQTYYSLLADQQDITMAELELRSACNLDPATGIQIDALLTFTDFNFNYSLDECMELAFKNRPDLMVDELTTLADLYGIKIAKADLLPKILFSGKIGKNGQNQAGQPFELTDEWTLKLEANWSLGANTGKYSYESKKTAPKKVGGPTDNTKATGTHHAELALFDKLDYFSNVAKAQVEETTALAELIELRAKVANEVEENYFNYQKAMTQVTAALSKIKYREKDLEVNRAKQMMDEVPLSQVLTAEVQLGEERTNYVKALADYYIAISGLFKAMGLAK